MTEYNKTALVTGASSGLGAEYCRQLAGQYKVIIAVARRGERLRELAAELAGRAEVHIVEADLTTEEGLTRTVESLRQKGPVDMLVNNAGFAVSGAFEGAHIDRQQAMVDLHIGATLRLTRAAVPFMRERGGGAVINISSMASLMPMKGVAVYAASKAFLNTFSLALQQELEGSGIRVQCLCPGYTRTEFADQPELADFDASLVPEELWMTADEVVRESLSALDTDKVLVVAGEQNRRLAALAVANLEQALA
jgi:uncharacterized protein